ncbi:hypothetical protein QTO34_013887, partial [Cnephaeus nilssonii]
MRYLPDAPVKHLYEELVRAGFPELAVGAVDPAPRGAETEEAEAVPAEVMVVAEGKAAVLAAPMAAAAED